MAATAVWGAAGMVQAFAMAAAAVPPIVSFLSVRAGVVQIREAYGGTGIVIFGMILLALGLAALGLGVALAVLSWIDDRILSTVQGVSTQG